MGKFHESIKGAPPVHDRERAARFLGELDDVAGARPGLAPLKKMLGRSGPVRDLLLGVFGASPFLTTLAMRDPEGLQDWMLCEPGDCLRRLATAMEEGMDAATNMAEAMRRLRRYRQRAALYLALADTGSVWDMERVTHALSEVAERATAAAVRFLFARAVEAGQLLPEDPAAPGASSGYFVLGVGKLGAYELNYSSDIDLIVFYDRSRARLAEGCEPAPFFVRVTRDLVRLLQERTADGYVFRTDLRLRPDPGATQVALSTDAGLAYYESFGQNWERAALIKARVIAGDHAAGEAFMAQLSPFIWRKYLDYAAIADIHAMKRRVHEFKGHGAIAVAGHNIKLGRGGIREIEFIVQTHQLIVGGRQQELRERGTLAVLRALAARNWIDPAAAEELASAYRFLRHVEHRLQMIADEQTQTLPEKAEELERIAHFSGFADARSFSEVLVGHLTRVQIHYDGLFARIPQAEALQEGSAFRADDESPDTATALAEIGFTDAESVLATVRGWRSGRYAATRSEQARQRLNEFLPELLGALAATDEPDAALAAFDRFLAGLPAGVQLFSLLAANPSLLRLIADIMGTAPRLARVLGRRVHALDAVLDPGFFGVLPPPEALSELIDRDVGSATHYQDVLDRARVVGTEQAFLIGVRVLSGTITADQAGGAYALLAENLIRVLHGAVAREIERSHGAVKGGQAAVIAMGKLGGREMTAASDLDLIIVYDFEGASAMSSGTKPLAGGQYYARFTQRLISALTAPTAEGALYQVDMRLRPSGNAGPVATRLDSFVDYQENHAWTWEHLALTRGRVVAGPQPLKRAIEEAIRTVLCRKRDRAKLAGDVVEMREKIDKDKGTADIWDLKNVRGGLVDLEFITQFLQISGARQHPEVLDQNTAGCLARLAAAGLLREEDAALLIPAARLYHGLTQILRLCLERPFDPATASAGLQALLAQAAGQSDLASVERRLRQTLEGVHEAFARLVV